MLSEEKALELIKEFSRIHKGIKVKVIEKGNNEMTVSFSGTACKTLNENEKFPAFSALLEGLLQRKVLIKESKKVKVNEFHIKYSIDTDPAEEIMKILDKYYEGVPMPQGFED